VHCARLDHRIRRSALVRVLPLVALGLLAARPAAAASLQQVTSWGASGVPTYIAMYIYVPDRLATNPPILVVSHYCGGDANGVFGQARTGGIVTAADQQGFIMIFPQNHLPGTTRNCWDVGSTASLTHDGGGDTQAIAQMVKYTLTRYSANANRVYAIGTSSGAMMTQALLAVYPDVFKAGAEFAGVPAGCWAVQYDASNQWSGPCAGGTVTHTAQEWGTLVRNMYPGYTGYRPRVQLWHGLADPTIKPANHTEAIKEWTNILGLAANPTSTTTVTLNNSQWTRQSWQDSCGFTVLDAWGEMNGPHGTGANMNGMYTLPFLGLDKTGDVDPVVAGCAGDGGVGGSGGGRGGSGGGAGGRGGASGSGGRGGAGGSGGARDGGADSGNDAATGAGGSATAGASGGGGGTAGAQGTAGSGGSASGSAGVSGTTGTGATGGSGVNARGGTGGSGSAGVSGTGGSASGGAMAGAGGSDPDPGPSGCSCVTGGAAANDRSLAPTALAMVLALVALGRRRRQR
jgi:poly(hydroxyalkanoate) depolymerase family esterase